MKGYYGGGIVPSDKSLEGPAILGEIPINSGIVEALVFSDKTCQQFLLGH